MLGFGIFLTLTIVSLVFAYKLIDPPPAIYSTEIPSEFYCGTQPDYHPDNEEGRALFQANCAACHHKFKRRTGPALAQVDSSSIRSWLSIDIVKIDSTKFSEYGIDYHKITWSNTLSKSEVAQIIDYCIRKY